MLPEMIPTSSYLNRMADGTIKQVNPFTGTEVWTVPGRGNRPLGDQGPDAGRKISNPHSLDFCAFCPDNYLKTPPEKARLVKVGDDYQIVRNVPASELSTTMAEFRRVPNLFEIIGYDYWSRNYGYEMPSELARRKDRYLSDTLGWRHVFDTVTAKLKAAGRTDTEIEDISVETKLAIANSFFAGGHELIIGRRHYQDGAEHEHQLCSSGALTPDEHYQYIRFTIDGILDIYRQNRYARYVAVFQNWLKAAGASFDHLHKQLVAIDGRSTSIDRELNLVRAIPNIYNEAAVNYAGYKNLVFAENDHAIAFADFGHRFPSLAIYSKSEHSQPWNHTPDELQAMSNMIHACHAAMGPAIPCNEEWYYKPPDADVSMPWHVLIKWRISNPAGFEGGTKIYVNTIDPESLRDKMVPRLFDLKNQGRIVPMKIAFECPCVPNCLKYNPAVRGTDRKGNFPYFSDLKDTDAATETPPQTLAVTTTPEKTPTNSQGKTSAKTQDEKV